MVGIWPRFSWSISHLISHPILPNLIPSPHHSITAPTALSHRSLPLLIPNRAYCSLIVHSLLRAMAALAVDLDSVIDRLLEGMFMAVSRTCSLKDQTTTAEGPLTTLQQCLQLNIKVFDILSFSF